MRIFALALALMIGGCSSSPRSLTPDEFEIGTGTGLDEWSPEIGVALKYNLRERAREMGR